MVEIPSAKLNIVRAAKSRLSPDDASAIAPPSVGPTQGTQTAPKRMPPRNCPPKLVRSISSKPASAWLEKLAVAVAKASEKSSMELLIDNLISRKC